MSAQQQRAARRVPPAVPSTSGVLQTRPTAARATAQMDSSNYRGQGDQQAKTPVIEQKKQQQRKGGRKPRLQRDDIQLNHNVETVESGQTESMDVEYSEESLMSQSSQVEPVAEEEADEERDKRLESILVDDDKFRLKELFFDSVQIEESDIPKPAYHGPQMFLAQNLLARIELMMKNPQALEDRFKKFRFHIYTANINMLKGQTQNRLADPAAECFSIHTSRCEKTLLEAAKERVSMYNTAKEVNKKHRELIKEAKENPDTLFLIVADEAHWGTTGQDKSNTDTNTETVQKKLKAYDKLVNSWNATKFPNVIVLQVTATPYNLMTDNTRLDLKTMCVWEERDGERVLRLVENGDETSKKVRLHHMKWTESFDYAIKAGVRQVIKIPEKSKGKNAESLYVAEDGKLKKHLTKHTEFIMKGENSDKVNILTSDNKVLVVLEEMASKTRTETVDVKFVPKESLAMYKACSYFFRITLCGQDVFLLETTDQRYKLMFSDKEVVAVDESECKATEEKPIIKGSFFVYSSQPLDSLEKEVEYVSLNFLYNSVGEHFVYNQYFRGDEDFESLLKEMKDFEEYDVLTADYALHILHINHIRQCQLQKETLEEVLKDMPSACGEYTKRRDALLAEFAEKCDPEGNSMITPALFEKVVAAFEKETENKLLEKLKKVKKTGKVKDVEDFLSLFVGCLLFLRKEALLNLQKRLVQEKHQHRTLFAAFETAFEKIDFKKKKGIRIEETETCRLIENLVIRDLDKQLEGPMKVVRMTTRSGNRMYATLCLARRLLSKQYTFEILRDYGTFSIADAGKNTDEATYRIRRILQRKHCSEVAKDGKRCNCRCYKPTTDLTCTGCQHVHTKIENYSDLNHLPCLVILVDKGRMGDTFPESFNSLDLRVSSENQSKWTLTPTAQELGRLCRYTSKSEEGEIPYALLGKSLAKKIKSFRKDFASFYAGFKKKDNYVNANNEPTPRHVDSGNTDTERNRILFEAEPQIGKTGVYLCLVSLLRRKIEERNHEEEEIEEMNVDGEDTVEVEEAAMDGVVAQGGDEELEEDWRYPYWQDIGASSGLVKTIKGGKYEPMFGSYTYGKTPERLISKTQKVPIKKPVSRIIRKSKDLEYRTYPKNPAQALSKQQACGSGSLFKADIGDIKVDLSVPTLRRFQPLLERLSLGDVHQEACHFSDKKETLRTWIFTPSYGRSKRAYLNFSHTMVDTDGNDVNYVHVIVVRSSEFYTYYREWGATHAIICLPEEMPEVGNIGPEEGGIGYTRLFIQLMAKALNIPAVFMLDDNILDCSEVKFTQNNEKMLVEKQDGKHQFKSVPLFACLRHMEEQLYGKGCPAPKEEDSFEVYPDENVARNTQECFTGPWSKYGIIGMLRRNQFVCTYKKPFKRTHVMAAVLVNINALTEKGLLYKPWQVWEDLHMNNQCDDAGLWVVKYNRFVLRKINMPDTLPKAFVWKEDTQMKNEIPSTDTDCILVLRRYINSCGLFTVVAPGKPQISACTDVDNLVQCLRSQNGPNHDYLLAIQDGKSSLSYIVSELKKVYIRGQEKLLLLLPASACRESNLTTRELVLALLQKAIKDDFDFDCVTSADVAETPVSLVLVYIRIAAQHLGNETSDPRHGQTGEIDTPSSLKDEPSHTQDEQRCAICNIDGQCGNVIGNVDIQWIKDEFGHLTSQSKICDACSSYVSAKERLIKRRESNTVVKSSPVENRPAVNDENPDSDSQEIPARKRKRKKPMVITSPESFEMTETHRSTPGVNEPAAYPGSGKVSLQEFPAKMPKPVRRQLIPETFESMDTQASVSPTSLIASSNGVGQATSLAIPSTSGAGDGTTPPIPGSSGVGLAASLPNHGTSMEPHPSTSAAQIQILTSPVGVGSENTKRDYISKAAAENMCIICRKQFENKESLEVHKKDEFAIFMAKGAMFHDEH